MLNFEMYTVSSLEKVLPKVRPSLYEDKNTAFKNEVFSYQLAMRAIESTRRDCRFTVTSDIAENVKVRVVGLAPCSLPMIDNSDDYIISDDAILCPDILQEDGETFTLRCNLWTALWITIKSDTALKVGKHSVKISIFDEENTLLGVSEYTLNVLDENLPSSDLVYTNWMHYDCISAYYNLEVFSDEYYDILRKYIKNASSHGMTMLYTPLFTPPLDTAVGTERQTVQLVGVQKNADKYTFNFEKLEKFIKVAKEEGISYFEMSHLYTQWGAANAPKIMATVGAEYKRIFGWDTLSDSAEYIDFLSQFLPKIVEFLESINITANCYFHVSDEPSMGNIEKYRSSQTLLKKYLSKFKLMDALSSYEFYEQGLVDIPVVALDHTDKFIASNAKDYWVYACCGQRNNFVSNRLMNMPSQRTRILGVQLYINDVKGYLQWGHNFYNSFLSRTRINPYIVTDAGGTLQSGDSFIVYPGADGVVNSLRHEVFFDGIQDYLALKLLESKIGREKVVNFLLSKGVEQNFSGYPKSALWHIELRKEINEMIVAK